MRLFIDRWSPVLVEKCSETIEKQHFIAGRAACIWLSVFPNVSVWNSRTWRGIDLLKSPYVLTTVSLSCPSVQVSVPNLTATRCRSTHGRNEARTEVRCLHYRRDNERPWLQSATAVD